MILFNYDDDSEAEGIRPAISFESKGRGPLTEQEVQAIASLEIAWALREIIKKLECIENEIRVGGSGH